MIDEKLINEFALELKSNKGYYDYSKKEFLKTLKAKGYISAYFFIIQSEWLANAYIKYLMKEIYQQKNIKAKEIAFYSAQSSIYSFNNSDIVN
tara:strand:+ start:139 stop:417 length:279 start_codon:yes stop_codon:yes gene_type:complete